MILITGATGHLGKAVIDNLISKGRPPANITALVRDEKKAADLKGKGVKVVEANYNNYESLVKAFTGVDKLLLISGTDPVTRTKQHENVVDAAKEAGIKHILYTSFERQNETDSSPLGIIAASHLNTEKKIKSSGIPYSILRNNIYADMIPIFLGEKVLETGIFFPAGNGKVGFALRSDMAEAFANVLAGSGHEHQEYYFSNSEELSFQEIADIISSVSGKQITYTSPAPDVYLKTLSKAGVPLHYAKVFADFGEAFNQGEWRTPKSDLETVLGRKPVSTRQFLTQVYGAK